MDRTLSRTVVLDSGEKDGEQSKGGEPGGDFVDGNNTERIGKVAQHGGADTTHPEGEAEKQTGTSRFVHSSAFGVKLR